MALPYKVDSLDDVPEAVREMYEGKDGEGFTLQVEGVKSESEIGQLVSALKKQREINKQLRDAGTSNLSAEDAEELERLRSDYAKREEDKAKQEGRWEDLRAKLQDKHATELSAREKRATELEAVVKRLAVTNALRSAIAEHGVKPEYHRAVELLLQSEGPEVQWKDGEDPVGVFVDELNGDKPIGEFVAEWVKSEAASPYMPPVTGGGGGGHGQDSSKNGASWEGKKYSEMTSDEKIAYTDANYGGAAA